MNYANLNIKCTEIIEYVIFKLMTCQYKTVNGETTKWNIGDASTLQEYIKTNRLYLVKKLKNKNYRELILEYNEIHEKWIDDGIYGDDDDRMIELDEQILDPIYEMFPNLVSLAHWDFACGVVKVIRSKLIDIAIDSVNGFV